MPDFHLLTEYQRRKVYKTCCRDWKKIKVRINIKMDIITISYIHNNESYFTKIKAN